MLMPPYLKKSLLEIHLSSCIRQLIDFTHPPNFLNDGRFKWSQRSDIFKPLQIIQDQAFCTYRGLFVGAFCRNRQYYVCGFDWLKKKYEKNHTINRMYNFLSKRQKIILSEIAPICRRKESKKLIAIMVWKSLHWLFE